MGYLGPKITIQHVICNALSCRWVAFSQLNVSLILGKLW